MTVTPRPVSGVRAPLVVTAAHLLACAAFLTVFLERSGDLPDPVATHFSGSGGADGFTALGSFPYQALGLLLVTALLFGGLVHAARGARGLVALGCGVAGFLCAVTVSVVLGNARAETADQVHFTLGTFGAAAAVAAVAAGLGALAAGRGAPATAPARAAAGPAAAVPRLGLREGESAIWTRSAGSRPLLIGGGALAAAGAVLVPLAGWAAGAGLMAGGAVLCACFGVRVTVDRHGLTVNVLGLPRPRVRIPLDRIAEAVHRDVDPLRDLGGWGYRAVPGRSGFALRSGDAVVARLTTGSEFVVTVDDAATAAALLNALAERARTANGGG
ncbi:hypothetical protein [Streptomyces telluris]|uniref:DUF1648 domain-containing protein n=1 Tax=Streptomyces telluris TaxID=2720021 RepID=A0A9X2LIJ3_9ACTN|nr:hypothetical protein [Streptomyces telluris]MCQ8771798.1 hypothetical protein [Streptomyces telluris]NJP77293.1 hypothetical protein [Streptomyces telluris]